MLLREMEEDFFTISQLNQFIKDILTAGIPRAVWVCGEIQQYDRNKSKHHIFFELVEKDAESKDIIARIGLVIFAGKKAHIEEILRKRENAFSLKDDIEVKFLCKVDFYVPHGAVRLIVESIDPVYTLGKLAQEKQRLIALLKEKGVLDKNKQLTFPAVPLKIGLITAYDSAAYNDFISELKKSGFGFKIFLHTALMQGKQAERQICKAIDFLDKSYKLDTIVITRGGGSIADLSCFDSQMIAEKISTSRVPILSGIGHEINMTITDLAAHTYAKTPTAIAQFLVATVREFMDTIEENTTKIVNHAKVKIERDKNHLRHIASTLKDSTIRFLKDHNEQLIRMRETIKTRPIILLNDHIKTIEDHRYHLLRVITTRIETEHKKIRHYEKMTTILSPKNTLRRGFTITRRKDGRILKDNQSIETGEEIITEFFDAYLHSTVTNITTGGQPNDRDEIQ